METGTNWKIKDPIFLNLLLGIPLILCGCLLVYVTKDDEAQLLFYVGMAMFVLGLLVSLYRAGATIDQRQGLIYKWKGIIFPLINRRYEIRDFSAVVISTHMLAKQSFGAVKHSPSYVVFLHNDVEADKGIVLLENRSFVKTRGLAIRAAHLMRVPVIDASGEKEVILGPEYLDSTLAERLRRGEVTLDEIPEPEKSRVKVSMENGARCVTVQRPGSEQLIIGILGLCFLIPVIYFLAIPEYLGIRDQSIRIIITAVLSVLMVVSLFLKVGTEVLFKVFPDYLEICRDYTIFSRKKIFYTSRIFDMGLHVELQNKFSGLDVYSLSVITAEENYKCKLQFGDKNDPPYFMNVLLKELKKAN